METILCPNPRIEPRPDRKRRSIDGIALSQFALDPEPHLAEFIAGIVAMRPGPVDWVVMEPGNDVPVTVVDGLPRCAPVVDDQVEPVGPRRPLNGPAKPGQQRPGMSREVVRQLREVRVMRLGHEQDMSFHDRVNIKKRNRVVRFKNRR